MPTEKRLNAQHATICSMPNERLGYFGWPSVARTGSGTLVVGVSGLRYEHVCPWGKTVLFRSHDDGRTWSEPRILNDTPLDDRDVGIVSLGGEKLLVTWFTSYIRPKLDVGEQPNEEQQRVIEALDAVPDDVLAKWRGSWVRTSVDGEAWSDFIRAPVSAPHGPILLADETLLYLGKQWYQPGDVDRKEQVGDVRAASSVDGGMTWAELGSVPLPERALNDELHEPHVVELASGRLIGLIRYEHRSEYEAYESFSLFQTESDDGGRTWTQTRSLGIYGSPPHAIRHSSGALVCVYGHRRDPYGERAMISRDDGASWDADWIVSDSPQRDLGYPASVELPDGKILTVYYQTLDAGHKNTGLLCSTWELPR